MGVVARQAIVNLAGTCGCVAVKIEACKTPGHSGKCCSGHSAHSTLRRSCSVAWGVDETPHPLPPVWLQEMALEREQAAFEQAGLGHGGGRGAAQGLDVYAPPQPKSRR